MANTSQLKLIAVDGSSNSDHAIEWFFQHIYREGDQVGIVHVHVLPDLPAFGFAGHPNYEKILETKYFENGNPVPGEYNMRIQESIVKAKGLVDKYKTALQVKGVANPKLFVETMHDSIGNTICQVALKNNASFIVIGQRGLGSIRRTLFGSVSVYVLHHANIPVIVVSPSQH